MAVAYNPKWQLHITLNANEIILSPRMHYIMYLWSYSLCNSNRSGAAVGSAMLAGYHSAPHMNHPCTFSVDVFGAVRGSRKCIWNVSYSCIKSLMQSDKEQMICSYVMVIWWLINNFSNISITSNSSNTNIYYAGDVTNVNIRHLSVFNLYNNIIFVN